MIGEGNQEWRWHDRSTHSETTFVGHWPVVSNRGGLFSLWLPQAVISALHCAGYGLRMVFQHSDTVRRRLHYLVCTAYRANRKRDSAQSASVSVETSRLHQLRDSHLTLLQELYAVIEYDFPRQIGKSATARQRATSLVQKSKGQSCPARSHTLRAASAKPTFGLFQTP
jgi:hypothetical protein